MFKKFLLFLLVSVISFTNFAAFARAEVKCKPAVPKPFIIELSYIDTIQKEVSKTSSTKSNRRGMVGELIEVKEKMEGIGRSSKEKGKTEKVKKTFKVVFTPRLETLEEGQSYKVVLDVTPRDKNIPSELKSSLARLKNWSLTLGSNRVRQLQSAKKMTFPIQDAALKDPVSLPIYCKVDCQDLNNKFRKVQHDLLELDSAMSFAEQFELFSSTMEEVQEVFSKTASDIESNKEKVKEKLDDALEKTEGLSASLTDFLKKVKKSEKLSKLDKGLDEAKEKFEGVAESAEEINKYLAILKKAVDARDASPGKQIEAFHDYFSDITDTLEPLVDSIPVIGVFLSLYKQAILQIAQSAKKIESVVRSRNRQAQELRKLGDQIPTPYIELDNQNRKLAKKKEELRGRLRALRDILIEECGDEPYVEDSPHILFIIDAKEEASRACKKYSVASAKTMPEEVRFWKQMKALEPVYKKKLHILKKRALFQTSRYPLNKKYKQIVLRVFERNGGISRIGIEMLNREVKKMKLRLRTLNEKGKRVRLKDAENREYNAISSQYLPGLEYNIGEWKRRFEDYKKIEQKYRKAQKNYSNTRQKDRKLYEQYRKCLREYIQKTAEKNGWDMKLVKEIHFNLFRK